MPTVRVKTVALSLKSLDEKFYEATVSLMSRLCHSDDALAERDDAAETTKVGLQVS